MISNIDIKNSVVVVVECELLRMSYVGILNATIIIVYYIFKYRYLIYIIDSSV